MYDVATCETPSDYYICLQKELKKTKLSSEYGDDRQVEAATSNAYSLLNLFLPNSSKSRNEVGALFFRDVQLISCSSY
jgi:hypothetical protein